MCSEKIVDFNVRKHELTFPVLYNIAKHRSHVCPHKSVRKVAAL